LNNTSVAADRAAAIAGVEFQNVEKTLRIQSGMAVSFSAVASAQNPSLAFFF
jgi:hypothetical protein